MKLRSLPFLALLAAACGLAAFAFRSEAGLKKSRSLTVAFYNLENLFDTEDDPATNDQEFTPGGENHWTREVYKQKQDNMARVISKLGDADGPEILGVAEVENRKVLEELVKHPLLKKHGYGIVHIDSPDERGIDCGLLYKKSIFLPLYSHAYPVTFAEKPEEKTRDILLVKGLIAKDHEITVLVNHWPSRRGGQAESEAARMRAATVARGIVDSIFALNPQASILLMGDFNDDPTDKSLAEGLKAAPDTLSALKTHLYNPMAAILAGGEGTLMYRQKWNIFDQIIMSQALLKKAAPLHYDGCSAAVYRTEWMTVEEGDYKGAPRRTFVKGQFMKDGFSDHFPVYLHLEY